MHESIKKSTTFSPYYVVGGEKRGETSHRPMFARSATETANRGSASSATRAVVNDSDATDIPSSLADGRMPTT